jgi:hypothetical protein
MERRRAYLERCKRAVAGKVAQVEAEEEERAAVRRKEVRQYVSVDSCMCACMRVSVFLLRNLKKLGFMSPPNLGF